MDIFQLRMKRAALKQALRDLHESLTNDQINKLLDQIKMLDELIELLENKKK